MDFLAGLEDEYEDIIEKAENGLKTKVKSLDLNEVSRELNLNLKALKKIKNKSYFPAEYDFNNNKSLKIFRIQLPFYQGYVNSYLIAKNGKCVIIDTAGSADAVIDRIKKHNLKPVCILLTHGHGDHVNGLGILENKYNIKVNKNKEIKFEGHKILRIKTPGHTNDSVTFHIENFLFSGDLIFAGSLGNGSYSYKKLLESASKILSLSKDYFIFPGHGPTTTVKQERENNAFSSF